MLSVFVFSQDKIVGGNKTDIEKIPWTANMRVVNTYGVRLLNRSAIIISENLVLTASHVWPNFSYDHLLVHVGGTCLDVGKYHKVHRVIKHPTLDLALLELETPLEFTEKVQPIDYKSSEDESLYDPGIRGIISGWGTTVPNDPSVTPLCVQSTKVEIISREEANEIFHMTVATDVTIASKGIDNKVTMAATGDSGGPIVVWDNKQQKYILAGVAKQADNRPIAANSSLTIYSMVKPAIGWIDSNKCEIVGRDTASSTVSYYEIKNMPPDVVSVKWLYSGLTEITADEHSTEVIPSGINSETSGLISALITTSKGQLTVSKKLHIKPRIDINAEIRYNTKGKYELILKPLNMSSMDNWDKVKCINDEQNVFGFVWTYNGTSAVGNEAVFDINPNSLAVHTVSVTKYNCESIIKLEKTFVVEKRNQEYIPVSNSWGNITIGGENLIVKAELFVSNSNVNFSYSKINSNHQLFVDTSPIKIDSETPETQYEDNSKYEAYLYSRTGQLVYKGYFKGKEPLNINTSALLPDIYILNIQNTYRKTIKQSNIVIN